MTITPEPQSTTTWAKETKHPTSITWDEADYTWDESWPDTWDSTTIHMDKETKHTSTFTNEPAS